MAGEPGETRWPSVTWRSGREEVQLEPDQHRGRPGRVRVSLSHASVSGDPSEQRHRVGHERGGGARAGSLSAPSPRASRAPGPVPTLQGRLKPKAAAEVHTRGRVAGAPHHRFWRVPQLPGPWDSPAGPSPSDLPTAWNRPPDLQPPLVLPGPCSPHPCPRGHHCVPATLTCERPALPSASGETQRPCLHRQQGGGGLLLCTCTKAPTCKPGPSVSPRECSSGHLTRPEAMVCPHGVRGQRRDFHFLPRLQKTCFVGDYHFTCVL